MAPTGEGVGWPRPIPVDEHWGDAAGLARAGHLETGQTGRGQLGRGSRRDSGRRGVL